MDRLEISEVLYQFVKQYYECAVEFHDNLHARLVKAKLDVKQAQLQVVESKKAIPQRELESGMNQMVPTVNPQTTYVDAVADYDMIKHLIKEEGQCVKEQKKDDFKVLTSSLSRWATLKAWWGLRRKQKSQHQLKKMPLFEQDATLIEQEEENKLGWFKRQIYRWFLKRKSLMIAAPLFPDWGNYIVYALCVALSLGCAYYIFLFVMYVSEDEADRWLGSVILTFFLTHVLVNPLLIIIRKCLLPLAATRCLHKTTILERLTTVRTAVKYFAHHGMSVAKVGTAGVVSVTQSYTPKMLVSIVMDKMKCTQSPKVLPILPVPRAISRDVKSTSLSLDEAPSQNYTVNSPSI